MNMMMACKTVDGKISKVKKELPDTYLESGVRVSILVGYFHTHD